MGIPNHKKWIKPVALGAFGIQEGSRCSFTNIETDDFINKLESSFDYERGVTAISFETKNGLIYSFGKKSKNHYTHKFTFTREH